MKKNRILLTALGLGAIMSLQSCINDDDDDRNLLYQPTAIVTVCPDTDGSFIMQLDDDTRLIPSNVKTSPYGNKEVRALVNYIEDNTQDATENLRYVRVNWIDSIRTKLPVPTLGELDEEHFGNDPLEIIKDWVTVAEDGYLTLRIRTLWGATGTPHAINLISGTNPDDPYELELRHDAHGDIDGVWGDALIAFNLNGLPRTDLNKEKITLRWNSFSGEKKAFFDIRMRPVNPMVNPLTVQYSGSVE